MLGGSMMNLRTPRRRISPRTRKKYAAIRNFLKRAIGNPSLTSVNKTCSNVAVDIRDTNIRQEYRIHNQSEDQGFLKQESSQKYNLEEQYTEELSQMSVHSEKTKPVSHQASKNTHIIFQSDKEHMQSDKMCENNMSRVKNKYFSKSRPILPTYSHDVNKEQYIPPEYPTRRKKSQKRYKDLNVQSEHNTFRKPRNLYNNENLSSTSYHSLSAITPSYFENSYCYKYPGRSRRMRFEENNDAVYAPVVNRYKSKEPLICHEDIINYGIKNKKPSEIDKDFIKNIINKQYKPVKLFDSRNSEISQISAPVCRDYEKPLRQITENKELHFGDYNNRRCTWDCREGVTVMRSACDTRTNGGKHGHRHKHRNKHTDIYNDSNFYDVVPVKEKSSPKSRRKFEEENNLKYYMYRDIPPSPRTRRPKLNLQSQHTLDNDVHASKSAKKYIENRREYLYDDSNGHESDDYVTAKDIKNPTKSRRKKRTNPIKSFMNPEDLYINNLTATADRVVENNDDDPTLCVPNTQRSDKADKALNEIKDILQIFLLEIKKESSSSATDNKSDATTPKTYNNEKNQTQFVETAKFGPNNGQMQYNRDLGKSEVPTCIPPFNPCCYPLFPMYPMNCMQNAYVLPSPSVTCPVCINSPKENITHRTSEHEVKSPNCRNTIKNNTLTDELIKEIYKCVSQKPTSSKDWKKASNNDEVLRKENNGIMDSARSDNVHQRQASKHDAQVGTPNLRCCSKSCEAFGSKISSQIFETKPQGTVSDTVLDKRSVNATITKSSNSILTSSGSVTTVVQEKKNKIKHILRSLGLMKKKKKDIILDLTESESTMSEKKTPFGRDIINYAVHGQEFYNQPPMPHSYHHHRMEDHSYDPRAPLHGMQMPPMSELYNSPRYCQYNPNIHDPRNMPSVNPFHHSHYNSQAPLCLKEVELKSIATQSDEKDNNNKSFFSNLRKKLQSSKSTDDNVDQRIMAQMEYENRSPAPWKKKWYMKPDEDTRVPWRKEWTTNRAQEPQPSWKNGWNTNRAPEPQSSWKKGWNTNRAPEPQPPWKKGWNTNRAPEPQFSWKKGWNPKQEPEPRVPWKRNANNNKRETDPLKFSLKTQKELAYGDMKLRNAMMKKLFYKKNPFSPRNLIIRTLLGKDKSSLGEPMGVYRPKMFF